jgi:hypothetical protein
MKPTQPTRAGNSSSLFPSGLGLSKKFSTPIILRSRTCSLQVVERVPCARNTAGNTQWTRSLYQARWCHESTLLPENIFSPLFRYTSDTWPPFLKKKRRKQLCFLSPSLPPFPCRSSLTLDAWPLVREKKEAQAALLLCVCVFVCVCECVIVCLCVFVNI